MLIMPLAIMPIIVLFLSCLSCRLRSCISLLLSILILASCSDRDIKTYRLAKPRVEQAKPALGLSWKTPDNWQELPSSGMRVASFLVKGLDASIVDVSLSRLEGDGGGTLPNVNRWRGQLSLSPWSPEALEKAQIRFKTPVGIATIVDFSHEDKRVIAALLFYNHETWFLKMTGSPEELDKQKPAFISLLDSLS